ncbi:MAG: methyltransferase domain-containing protein [Dokdonella sp.]|uniref:class I SAM-dependent methyltransferase n=1 Tax=Dokdonella sp. TaxID=2291710 RepID=UPI0032675E9D
MDSVDDPALHQQRSWDANVDAWTRSVRDHRIPSRRAGTDRAVVDATLQSTARRVLDLGCGEGWLARALAARGIEVVGIDASARLIAAAKALGGATFTAITYDQLMRTDHLQPFDAVVANFALLDEDVDTPLRAARARLRSRGTLIVQTVHPWIARGDRPYEDGWRVETFAGFGEGFREPMPWYFRTLSSWAAAIADAGFRVDRWNEPMHPDTGMPLSLLISASRVDDAPRG